MWKQGYFEQALQRWNAWKYRQWGEEKKNLADVFLSDLFDILLRTCQHKMLCENSVEENANTLCLSRRGLSSWDITYMPCGYASQNKFLLIRISLQHLHLRIGCSSQHSQLVVKFGNMGRTTSTLVHIQVTANSSIIYIKCYFLDQNYRRPER